LYKVFSEIIYGNAKSNFGKGVAAATGGEEDGKQKINAILAILLANAKNPELI
jgi:hypothetical protein